jgi:type I restriction enzyme S subunit
LDKAEFLRAKRREGLRKSELLEAGTFYAAFGVSAEWESERIVPLESVCSQITDGAHQTPTYVDEGIPFVTVTNITSGNLDLSGTKFISKQEHESLTKRTRPEYGDILVSKDGTIGVPCPVLTDEEFSIFVSVALLKLRRDVIDPVFLTAQLRLSWVQRQIIAGTKGIAIRHLHLSDFKRLRIFVPPLSQQKRFASQVEAIGVFNTRLINSLSGFDTLVASLQHRAFRGEL